MSTVPPTLHQILSTVHYNIHKNRNFYNNFKQNSILPKTGGDSSNTISIVTGLGLIIGVLGIRRYNR